MRHPRLYTDRALTAGAEVSLDRDAAHYLGRVLRLKPGAPLTLFNGRGGEYAATLTELSRDNARVQIASHDAVERESPLAITLIQGIARGERMDYTIQKAVELGVDRIMPVETARSVVRLKPERRRKRLMHWQAIARAAAMQCGRNRVPEVIDSATLAAALDAAATAHKLLLEPDGAAPLSALARPADAGVTLLIGPEGGLSAEEARHARTRGFQPVRLGPRTLRTETAGVAALAALQTLWGDMG